MEHGTVVLYTGDIENLRQYAALNLMFFKNNFGQSITKYYGNFKKFLLRQQQVLCNIFIVSQHSCERIRRFDASVSLFFTLLLREERGRKKEFPE